MKIKRFQLFLTEDDGGGTGAAATATTEEHEEPVVETPTEKSKEFYAKFAHNRKELQPQPLETTIEPVEVKKEETPAPIKKIGGSNVPKILEEKRKAEAEREEFKNRAEKFEKEEKPTLEKKISDLEAQIAEGGHTKAEAKALQDRLDAAESKLVEREASLVNENKDLRSRLCFHDIQGDPDLQRDFVLPVKNAYSEAVDTFQGDQQKIALLRKAALANGAALNATTIEERQAQERERNTILSQIKESMDEFAGGQFSAAINDYIRSTKTHANALMKHEETRSELMKRRDETRAQEVSKTFNQWTNESKRMAPEFDGDIKLEGEVLDTIKELKLDPQEEVQEASKVLEKVITGRASMTESIHLLHRGRVYPALVAKAKAQEHIIKGLRETISKLKGTKPGGDSKDGREHNTPAKEDINHRFRASRPGIGGRSE